MNSRSRFISFTWEDASRVETFTDTGEDHILLALGIAIVFVMVYVITWINERKYAADFNEKLKAYQAENAKE